MGMKLRVILGVASAIDFLREQSIVHRDLKPSNVLRDESFHPKLCDFDISREIDDVEATVCVGTTGYMAPEVSNSTQYNDKVDLYSFGVVVYEMFEGTRAFQKSFCTENPRPCFTDKTPTPVQQLIETCVECNPDYRCSFLDDGISLYGQVSTLVTDILLDERDKQLVQEYMEYIENAGYA